MYKILMLLNEDPLNPSGGLGVHVRELCNQLRKYNDLDVTILGADYSGQNGGFYTIGDDIKKVSLEEWKYKPNQARLLKIYNTNDIHTNFGSITKMISEDMFVENALMYLREEKFDVIHLHDANLYRTAKMLKLYYRAKLFVTCHLSYFLVHPMNPDSPFYLYEVEVEGNAFHCCDCLISVSKKYGDKISEAYFLDRDIPVIYNGVNSKFLSNVKYDGELRKKYGDKPLITFVGRLVPSKGISLILDAVKELPNYHFNLISNLAPTLESNYPLVKAIKKLKQTCTNFEWFNNIGQEQKWQLMKISDLALMPSLHEPFGITALEWMGLGIPLIVSSEGGLSEFCNAQNSTVIKPTSQNLIYAISNYKQSRERIDNGLKTAQEFCWDRVAEQTKKLYKEALNARQTSIDSIS